MRHTESIEGKIKKRASGIIIAGALFCLDQSVKYSFPASDRYYCNHDGPWGTVMHEEVLLSGGALLLVAFGTFLLRARGWREIVAFAFLFGGGLSNLVDRALYGCVRDFSVVSWFPAFNFADVCLSVGAGLLLTTLFSRARNSEISISRESHDASVR